jgi:flagellar basal-body rod protein FlgB
MRVENMSNFTNIIGTAMQGNLVRGNVITNNIANADTPGFKRGAVSFEGHLQAAVADFQKTGQLDLSNVRPRFFTQYDHLNYRIDENNVDIEHEMTQLYQNSVRFEVMAGSVMHHYRTINMVIQNM